METQIKSKHSEQRDWKEVLNPDNRWFRVAISVLMVVLIAAIIVLTMPVPNQPANLQRARQAQAARYSALGEYYQAKQEANLQHGREAESARYNGLAEFYLEGQMMSVQRGREAEAARYTALGEYYQTKQEANLQRAREADIARYNGWAKYYVP